VGRFGCAVLNAIRVVELNTNELGVIYNLYPYFDLAESAESAPLKKRSRIFFPLFFSLCLVRCSLLCLNSRMKVLHSGCNLPPLMKCDQLSQGATRMLHDLAHSQRIEIK
jgi:hypothetical protein